MSSIFGGSKTTQQATSKPVDMTPGEFTALRKPFADELLKIIQNGGVGNYEGPLNADITPEETALLQQLQGQTGPNTARQGVINDTLAGKFLPGQEGSNPFLQAAIEAAQRPTLQGLEETLSRSLPGRFTQAGQIVQSNANGGTGGGSSAFDRAAAIATRGAADAIGDIATKMSSSAYESERGRQQEAVSLDRAEVDATVTNLQAQALPRLIEELGIERGLAEFQRRTQSLLEVLKTMGGVTSPTVAQNSQSSGSSTTSPNIFGTLFPKGL
jgi:hypothetical protein